MAEIDPFKELPETKQGLQLYTGYARNEIKKLERKKKKLESSIEEAHRRLGIQQEVAA